MIPDSKLIELSRDSFSVSDLMTKLGLVPMGGNHNHYKRRITNLGIVFKKRESTARIKRNINDYLVLNGPSITTYKLKKRLLREGLKTNICEICGQGPIWNGLPLVLQLDHKDGNKRNNTLYNLQILCPNCHTQTETYAVVKTVRMPRELSDGIVRETNRNKYFCKCGAEIYKQNKTGLCRKCHEVQFPPPRKISNCPERDVLLAEVASLRYNGVSRKYGVSYNTVRKWVKSVRRSPV